MAWFLRKQEAGSSIIPVSNPIAEFQILKVEHGANFSEDAFSLF